MAQLKYKTMTVTPTDLYSLERKSISKLFHTYPAVNDDKSMEEMAPKTAYGPLYTLTQHELSLQNDEGDRIVQTFTRNLTNAELRRGFVHTEIGRHVAQMGTTTVQPGDTLAYKVQEGVRLFEETIEKDPVRLRVGINTKQFQYIEAFTEADHYMQIMDSIPSVAAIAIRDAIKTFAYSILLSNNTKIFIKNYYMDRLFGKNLQLEDDTESKAGKEFYKNDGEFRKLCKEAAGEFQAKFKNKRFFNPIFRAVCDPDRMGDYKVVATTAASSEADVKAKCKAKFTIDGEEADETMKKKPPKFLTRDNCIFAMIEQIIQTVSDLSRIPAVENGMGYDPYATTQPTGKQLPIMCKKENLVLFMNPKDLAACRRGAAYTSAGGTVYSPLSLNDIGIGAEFELDGMLPGEAALIDGRAINIIPIFSQMYKNFNGGDLVDQTFVHAQFRWGIFFYFAGVGIEAVKGVPDAQGYAEFAPVGEAA